MKILRSCSAMYLWIANFLLTTTRKRSYSQNWKSEEAQWLLNYWMIQLLGRLCTVITNLKRLKICFAFGFFRVFVIWVKRFLGAFKRHQVYSIGFAIHFITKGATITWIIVIMKDWSKKYRTKVQKVLFTLFKLFPWK